MSTKTRNLSNIDGANTGAPSSNSFSANMLDSYANDAAFQVDFPVPVAGNIYWNTTEKCLREYNGTAWQYDKTTMITATDSTSTGADQSITPDAAQMIRFTSNTLTSINNIVPTLQKMIYLANDQSTQSITIKYDTGGTAANRIRTGNNLDYVLKVNQIAGFIYDNINARWRLIEKSLTTSLEAFASDALYSAAHAGLVAGDTYWNTVDLVARIYDGTGWQNNKVLFSTEVQSAPTGAAVDITPVRDQIIKVSNASLTSIRGVIPTIQKFLVLVNGTGATISILNEDLTATAANRIVTGTGLDISVANDASILMSYDNNSSRWRVTGGSGSGTSTDTNPINYITSPSTAIGWTRTGTTGAAGNAPATTTTAADLPLGPTIPTAIKILSAANAGAESAAYVSFPFTTPAAGGVLTQVSLFMKPGSNFIANEWTVSVYQGSTRQTLRTDSSGFTFLPNFTGQFPLTFEPLASTAYTLRLARTVNAGLNVGQLNIAQVYVGPGIISQTAPISDWQSYTPTIVGLGTVSGLSVQWMRLNSNLIVSGKLIAGTSTAVPVSISLPTGLTGDGTKFTAAQTILGEFQGLAGVAVWNQAAGAVGWIFANTSSPTNVNIAVTTSSTSLSPANGSSVLSSGQGLTFKFMIPIVEWANSGINIGAGANVQVYSSSTGTWDAAAAAGNTVAGYSAITGSLTATRTKVVRLPFAPQSISDVKIVFLPTGYTAPVPIELYGGYVGLPAVDFGARVTGISGTDVTVSFYQYHFQGTTYNSLTGAVNWVAGDAFWALMVANPSAPVGFGPATATDSGLVKGGTVPGSTSGVAIATGYLGEVLTITQSTSTNVTGTTTQFFNLLTITTSNLPIGQWAMFGIATLQPNGAAGFTAPFGSVSDFSGNTLTDHLYPTQTQLPTTIDALTTPNSICNFSGSIITVTASSTKYIKARCDYSAGTPQYRYSFRFVRMG